MIWNEERHNFELFAILKYNLTKVNYVSKKVSTDMRVVLNRSTDAAGKMYGCYPAHRWV